MTFERIVQVGPAWDKRDPDPSKDYGVGSMSLRFILKGPKGAVQFVFYTSQYTRPVAERMWLDHSRRYNPFKGMGADIGYHAYTPQYEGQTPMEKCDVLGCDCYYDGTSLGAEEFSDKFIEGGDKVVWPMLEKRYAAQFGE